MSGLVHESAPTQQVLVADASVEVLDGAANVLQVVQTDLNGQFTVRLGAAIPALRISKNGYDTSEVLLPSSPSPGPVDVALMPIVQTLTSEGSSALCNDVFLKQPGWYEKYCLPVGAVNVDDVFSFDIHHSGTFKLETWWALDFADILETQLRCGDNLVYQLDDRDRSTGQGFEIMVPGGCRYTLKFHLFSGDYPFVQYKYRVHRPS